MSITIPSTVASEFEARFQHLPTGNVDQKELERWQEMCRALIEERNRLKSDLAATQAERDDYRKALLAHLASDEVSFTKEELFACRGQRPTLRELIRDLESQES